MAAHHDAEHRECWPDDGQWRRGIPIGNT
jgi:hypothetical protein